MKDVSGELRISRVLSPITALGPGRRVGLWVQGCALACDGCASRDTWDPLGGRAMSVAQAADLVTGLFRDDPSLGGLTLTGGEPVDQGDPLADLVTHVRGEVDGLDVLLFTGYAAAPARRRARRLLAVVDTVVAGRYQADRGLGGRLVASRNQTVEHLTSRGAERWAEDDDVADLQVAVIDDELLVVGIPAPGELDLLRDELAAVGVRLGAVSWQP